jgi:hypothetical protein
MHLNEHSPRDLALNLIQRVFARNPDGVHTFANAVRDAAGEEALPDRAAVSAAVARGWAYLEENGLIAPAKCEPSRAWALTEDGHRVLRMPCAVTSPLNSS